MHLNELCSGLNLVILNIVENKSLEATQQIAFKVLSNSFCSGQCEESVKIAKNNVDQSHPFSNLQTVTSVSIMFDVCLSVVWTPFSTLSLNPPPLEVIFYDNAFTYSLLLGLLTLTEGLSMGFE